MTRLTYTNQVVKTKGFLLYLLIMASFISLAFRSYIPSPFHQESFNEGITASNAPELVTLLPMAEVTALPTEKDFDKEEASDPTPRSKKKKRRKKARKTSTKPEIHRSTDIFLRAFKLEGELEVWSKIPNSNQYELIRSYPFCQFSGRLGPKRQRGDLQIPEGFYHINKFNPNSNYHLSLGVNYPNQSDRILGNRSLLGGSIFIHGGCVTIGCIPITDTWIEELYAFAELARQNGQKKINVHIFPARMTDETMSKLYTGYPQHINFWESLREGYWSFERTHKVPYMKVDNEGQYLVAAP